jgi:hypothetical protein
MTTHKEAILTLANAIESVAQVGLELEVPTGESVSALATAIEVLEELYAVEEADLIKGLKATLLEVDEVVSSY